MITLLKRIIYKIARRKFVRNFSKFCTKKKGRALIYFKTEEFLLHGFFQDFSHVNNWESYEISRILNKLGFVVDILDRTATLDDIEKYIQNNYDLFVGIGAGDSGQYFADIAERIPKAIKVLYAMGPEPDLSNTITKARHDYFRLRHPGVPVLDRRMITAVDTKRLYHNTDVILTIGNEFSHDSYLHLGKDVHKIYLSTYPGLSFDQGEIFFKNPKKFLYFGGNGNIVKGLDLVLEVFEKHPELELYIGAPDNENDFNIFAHPIIQRCKNIHKLGFIDVTGQLFQDITKICGYVILPSASEGCATSVTTCMRRGCIPVVTIEAGVPLGNFGFLVSSGTIEAVETTVIGAAYLQKDEFTRRVQEAYTESFKYTHSHFSSSVEGAVTAILKKHNYLV